MRLTNELSWIPANKDVGCNGESLHIKGGECMEKGDYKSVVFQ